MKQLLLLFPLVALGLLAACLFITPTYSAGPTATIISGQIITPTPSGDPATWHTVRGPVTSGLRSILAVASDDVWVAGDTMLHWDGRTFQPVAFPVPAWLSGETPDIAALDGANATSIWAIGSYFVGFPLFERQAMGAHWDGRQWTSIPSTYTGTDSNNSYGGSLNTDVSAIGANDAFVVGGQNGGFNNNYPRFERCTADQCTYLAADFPYNSFLNRVAALASDDVWVLDLDSTSGYDFIERWTGSPTMTLMLTSTMSLRDMTAIAADDVWIVGGTRASLIEHWNGGTWSTISNPDIGPLAAIKARSADDIWAYGNGVLHWDGSTWGQVPGQHADVVADLSPLGPAEAWTVGYRTSDPTTPIVEHYGVIPTFSDVPAGDTFYSYVGWMARQGIIGGYVCGGADEPCDGYGRPYFRPGTGVNRGQMLKMVTLAAGWPLLNPPTATFADVAPGSTFYQAIETGTAHGIITGYPCGGTGEPCDTNHRPYFRPAAAVSRGQLSKILALARNYPPLDPPTATFADVPPSNTFYGYVETVVAQGIVSGYPCGGSGEPCDGGHRPYFRPANGATRAQVSKMVTRAYGGP